MGSRGSLLESSPLRSTAMNISRHEPSTPLHLVQETAAVVFIQTLTCTFHGQHKHAQRLRHGTCGVLPETSHGPLDIYL